jgi:hypothetical protein
MPGTADLTWITFMTGNELSNDEMPPKALQLLLKIVMLERLYIN